MFDSNYVYDACLLAASEGIEVGAFGNACGKHYDSRGGEGYRSSFYQNIASLYGERAKHLGRDECWRLYTLGTSSTSSNRG